MEKRISPAVLVSLKQALVLSFWYKNDLRSFLESTMDDQALIARLNWDQYKRGIVAQLVDTMAKDQHRFFDDLLAITLATSEITDPSHLRSLEDGEDKYAAAVMALAALRTQVEPYLQLRSGEEQAERRRRAEKIRAEQQRALVDRLGELMAQFQGMLSAEPHERGYALERLLNELFAVYDIDARKSFKVAGEQIDGAFTHEGTEFILEARWRSDKSDPSELDVFASKVSRKLDNTLGLFVSINGFSASGVELHSQNRPVIVLMDGSDLTAVLENRIQLPELITRKRQHAARTGQILLSASDILRGV